MAYSGGQQVFSPYAAMGNSPGMMIDPNGEKTKYADPVTGDAIVDYGGMDAVTLRAYLASFRNGNFNGMYGLNTLLMEAGGGGGGTYRQARTLYFNVLAFFEEALNRKVISSYQLDFGGDDTYIYVAYYESRTETAISDEDGDVLEGVTLVDKKKTYIVPISSYLSDLHFEHSNGYPKRIEPYSIFNILVSQNIGKAYYDENGEFERFQYGGAGGLEYLGGVKGLKAIKAAAQVAREGMKIFGKEVVKLQPVWEEMVIFKDGSKIDVNAARVKEWIPNPHPSAPAGTLQKIKFDKFLPGSKGYKRTPTEGEINFLNLFK